MSVVTLRGQPERDLGPTVRRRGRTIDVGAGLARRTCPGPARTHLVPLHRSADPVLVVQPAQLTKRRLLTHFPLSALDKLKHRDVQTSVPRPQRHSERRGRFSFAFTGVYRQYRHVAPGPGGQAIVGHCERIALRHVWLPIHRQATPRTACTR